MKRYAAVALGSPLPVVEALIAVGADVNIKNNKGATPLNMAKMIQRHEIAELSEQHESTLAGVTASPKTTPLASMKFAE